MNDAGAISIDMALNGLANRYGVYCPLDHMRTIVPGNVALRSTRTVWFILVACSDPISQDQHPVDPDPRTVSYAVQIGVGALPGASDGTVIARGHSGVGIRKLDLDGTVVWNMPLEGCPDEFSCSTIVDDAGSVYATTRTGLVKISSAGTRMWHNPTVDGALAVFGGERLYATSMLFGRDPPYHLFSVDPGSGEKVWQISFSDFMVRQMYVDERRENLFLIQDGRVRVVSPRTGGIKWEYTHPTCRSYSTAALTKGGTLILPCRTGANVGILALLPDGRVSWEAIARFFAATYSTPLIDGRGNIFLVTGDAVVSFTQRGSFRWIYEYPAGARIGFSQPVLDRFGNVYLVDRITPTAATTIAAVNATGRLEIVRADPPHALSLLILRDGRVVFPGESLLHVFQSGGYDPASQWALDGGDPGRQGRAR